MNIIKDTTIEAKSIINNKTFIKDEIRKANETGFINNLFDSNLALTPKLIINDYSRGTTGNIKLRFVSVHANTALTRSLDPFSVNANFSLKYSAKIILPP